MGEAELLADVFFTEDPRVRAQQDGCHAATRWVGGWDRKGAGAEALNMGVAGLYPLPPGISTIIGVEFAGVVEVASSKWKVGDEVHVIFLVLSWTAC